jgi:tetratricopeptide (TPR) repeat protein
LCANRVDWILIILGPAVLVVILLLIAVWILRTGIFTWARLARAPAKALARKDPAEAQRALAKALARARRFSPHDHRRGRMMLELVAFLKTQGRYAEAKTLVEECVEILAHHKHSDPTLYFIALNNLAVYHMDVEDYAAAQRVLELVLDLTLLLKKRDDATSAAAFHFMQFVLHVNLVVLFVAVHELDEAAHHQEEAAASFAKLTKGQQASVGDFYHATCARLLHAQGQFQRAATVLEQVANPQSPACLPMRAKLCLVRLEFAEAELLLRQYFDILETSGTRHIPGSRQPTLDLAESLFGEGKHEEAFTALYEARALVVDFALPQGTSWRKLLTKWLDRAKELGRTDMVTLLDADLQKRMVEPEHGITISARLRAGPPLNPDRPERGAARNSK